MIKCEVIKEFKLKEFSKLQELTRKNPSKNENGKLYEGDIFKCNYEMANYLIGNNKDKITVVRIIEIKPEVAEKEEKAKKKTSKK